jgi:hypothetical protein
MAKTKSFVIPDDGEFNECLFMVAHPNSKHVKDNTNPEVGINLYLIAEIILI